jgi:hypothetical protein
MPIDGVRISENTTHSIFYIDELSDALKQIIRDQLQGVWNGFSNTESLPSYYSYKNTLSSFLDRYNSKADETKKGMVGELLSHILLGHQENNLTSLSILKNKEERSIKKGFDIIYCEIDKDKLWYSEVKSGGLNSTTTSSYNDILLNKAKDGIQAMINENRSSLWESALFDVSANIKECDGQLNLQELLSNDSPIMTTEQSKNVILISVLYHSLTDEIDINSVENFRNSVITEGVFLDTIVISIQKATFLAVSDFLNNEITIL